MTVAAKVSTAVPARSGTGSRAKGARPWRKLWQVPLLIAGLALFGFGVRAFVRTIRPVPFDAQVEGIQSLLAAEKYDVAVAEINRIAEHYVEPLQQGELQVLAGDAHYLVQRDQPLVRENYERVLKHYGWAVDFGVKPNAVMNERWGVAALALGDALTAVGKLEAAVTMKPALLESHGREMVNAYAGAGQLDKAQAVLNRLLVKAPATAPADHQEAVQHAGGGEPAGGAEHGHAAPGHMERKGERRHAESVDNRVWALCKQIELSIASRSGGEHLLQMINRAREALGDIPEPEPSGRVLTWIGRGELQRGNMEAAKRDLTEARKRFLTRNSDDGRAAVLLAKIAEAKGELDRAAKIYAEVVAAHSGTAVWAAARLGRAEIFVRQALEKHAAGSVISEEALADYQYALAAVKDTGEHTAELIGREGVEAALVADYERSLNAEQYGAALTFLALQQEMGGAETEAMAFRLASTRELRAEELLAEAGRVPAAEALEKAEAARGLFAQAAADYQRHSRLATMQDDLSGDSQWKAAQLFDKAGEPMKSVAIYEQFTRARPRDPRVPDALLATGRLYQSAGMLEKAIAMYVRNMAENSKTPPAYTSAVNLARCYMTLADVGGGEGAATQPGVARKEAFEKAETALLSLVQNNTDLLPAANEFRVSLFTLGELYFRNGRWADAILRLEEAVKRYPDDRGMPRSLFLLAESYRKSAEEIGEAVRKDPAIAGRDVLESARAERLGQAAGLFTRVIALLDPEGDGAAPGGIGAHEAVEKLSPLEASYVRTSYLNRAACAYDRGDFAAAIKLYDEVATRFSEEAVAARAYVQIVNAYLALKEPTQAAAAAERGRWVLKRIPDEAFAASNLPSMGAAETRAGRAYYDRLLSLGGTIRN